MRRKRKTTNCFRKFRGLRIIGSLVALFVATALSAQEAQHLKVTQPGGFPGWPVLTGIERATNGVRVSWDGPAGYYQLYQKTNLTSGTWQKVGTANIDRVTTVTNTSGGRQFFKINGPAPQYAGSQACLTCHANVHSAVAGTAHARAFDKLVQAHLDKDPNYLPSYTVGYGLPTGYNTNTASASLKGVQCESCHGPAARHAANELDLSVRPRKELAGEVCGGCHSGAQHPIFEEWKTSGHFAVVEDMNDPGRINSCGRCHSGSARLALMKGLNPAVAVTNDANVGITCAVCHDPHQTHVWTNVVTRVVYTNQLRYALSSTNDFYLSTSDNFTNKFDPKINVCAQCHNHRGASWTSSSRPPHHSPQYNMLLGTVGVLPTGVTSGPASHAGTRLIPTGAGAVMITNQCVSCHMQKHGYDAGPPSVAAVSGHTFKVTTFEACAECHGSAGNAEAFADFISGYVAARIQVIKSSLDEWAAMKAPGSLYATYGNRAWEYTTPGDLSTGGSGPSASEQALIPDNIKKARFNLYLVLYDGSYGVHNGPHSLTLLDAAQDWVDEEKAK